MSGSLRALALLLGLLFGLCPALGAGWGALVVGCCLVGVGVVAWHEADHR